MARKPTRAPKEDLRVLLKQILKEISELREALARIEAARNEVAADPATGDTPTTPTNPSTAAVLEDTVTLAGYAGPIVEPAVPVQWVWQRIALALGMNASTMYYSKPLKNVNKAALAKRLNDLFDDQGITVYTTDLAKAATVGDVYDVIMDKL